MPSLKDIKAQVNNPVSPTNGIATEIEEEITSGPGKTISQESFQVVWKELVNQKKAEDKTSEYMILNRPVTLNENLEILLELENPVQISQFDAIRADFMGDLRRRLGNNRVQVKLEVREQDNGRKLYTSQDKFNYLSEKYPILPDLKKRLGLDTDF